MAASFRLKQAQAAKTQSAAAGLEADDATKDEPVQEEEEVDDVENADDTLGGVIDPLSSSSEDEGDEDNLPKKKRDEVIEDKV